MTDFTVKFDKSSFELLDQLALLAQQDYNLGSAGKWFNEFRGGLYGFYARLYGVETHYEEVHAWRPRLLSPTVTEYHLTAIFFHMDSAIECLTFAFNALGWAVAPNEFRDVTKDSGGLRAVSPTDVYGARPQPGFAAVFPNLQALWQSHVRVLTRIVELHDVSKHRQMISVGGQARSDPPDGFFERLGVPASDTIRRALLHPPAEIILRDEPKVPAVHRVPAAIEKRELLEELVPAFANLVNLSGRAALEDARANVPLKEAQLRTP